MADVAELSEQHQWPLSHSCFVLCIVVSCWVFPLAVVVLQTLPAVPQDQDTSAACLSLQHLPMCTALHINTAVSEGL